LLSPLDIFKGFDNEPLTVISVRPARLPGTLMVQHVCIGDEAVGLDTLDLDAKDSTCHHHSDFGVLLERELPILRHLIANCIVVLLDVSDFLTDLVLEWTSL